MTYKVVPLNLDQGVLDQFLDEAKAAGLSPGDFASICITAIISGGIRQNRATPYERIDWPRIRGLIQTPDEC